MRWITGIVGLVMSWTLLGGCQQPSFVQEPDLFEAAQRWQLPPRPENDPSAGIVPFLDKVSEPATVTDPERTPRYLTLREAFAVALESGTSGVQSTKAPGIAIDDLVSFTGQGVAGSDRIRVFALQPAINGAAVEAALARFDAQWLSSLSWTTTDQPTQGFSSFSNGEAASLSTSLAKPLPTGGVAGITFSTNYQDLANPPGGAFKVLNPSYTTNLQFGVEQPLLRNFGVEMNQLISGFPGSSLFPGINARQAALAPEGIVITRLRFDQQRAEFERRINFLLLNVEVAYWNLYGAYVSLFSADQGLRQARESWRITLDRRLAGADDPVIIAQTRAQYEQFRIDRIQAIGKVLESERNLRILLGLKMEDGQRLVPADPPTLAPYLPNWDAALADALSLRPELVLAREDLKAKQFALIAARNLLRPDLRFQATYTLVGLGSRLDGNGNFIGSGGFPVTTNSLHSLASGDFVNWNVGLNLNVPIGFRNELAQVRQARLALAQAFEVLKDQENKAHNVLAREFRQIIESYKVIEARRIRRLTLAQELNLLNSKVAIGALLPTNRALFGDSLLDAQRLWATALSDEYQAIVDYNTALALFEFAKGTIQQHDKVFIAEGPLPDYAQVRAVEHERERTQALVLRERANPFVPGGGGDAVVANWPEFAAPSLPSLWEQGPPLDKTAPVDRLPDFGRVPQPNPQPSPAAPARKTSTQLGSPVRLAAPTSSVVDAQEQPNSPMPVNAQAMPPLVPHLEAPLELHK